MINVSFNIQNTNFQTALSEIVDNSVIHVLSTPRPYDVSFISGNKNLHWLVQDMNKQNFPLVFIDKKVYENGLNILNIKDIPIFIFDAYEKNKDINMVLDLCNFLKENNANRGSMLYVIGGGITQDIGAFAGYIYRRGIPWTYIPTTLLSQTDSCMGGKCALNFSGTKNMIALFSAPRRILIDVNFLRTLRTRDILSGLGETLRLAITGGEASLQMFEKNIDDAINGSLSAYQLLITSALLIKKAIVDKDEFELDLRRSMNYGHSIGHSIEALSDYRIPHGSAVAVGIMIENQISVNRGLLCKNHSRRINNLAMKIIPNEIFTILKSLNTDQLLPLLSNDKKAEGKVLKLVTLKNIGSMIFIGLTLDQTGLSEISNAISDTLASIER